MNDNLDVKHLLTVALGGALTAVAADLVYNNYGDEVRNLLAEVLKLFASVQSTGTATGAPRV